MRMKLIALFLLVGSVALTGCFEDNMVTYDGPPQVEFKPTTATVPAGSGVYTMRVQLIGEQRNAPVDIGFTVVDSLTTAQAGVHYNFVTQNNTLTIDANDSFGEIEVQVLSATTAGTLAVALTGNEGEGIIPAENYKTFRLNIAP